MCPLKLRHFVFAHLERLQSAGFNRNINHAVQEILNDGLRCFKPFRLGGCRLYGHSRHQIFVPRYRHAISGQFQIRTIHRGTFIPLAYMLVKVCSVTPSLSCHIPCAFALQIAYGICNGLGNFFICSNGYICFQHTTYRFQYAGNCLYVQRNGIHAFFANRVDATLVAVEIVVFSEDLCIVTRHPRKEAVEIDGVVICGRRLRQVEYLSKPTIFLLASKVSL